MKNKYLKILASTLLILFTGVGSSNAMEQTEHPPLSWASSHDFMTALFPHIAPQDLESFSAVCHGWNAHSHKFVDQLKGYKLINAIRGKTLEDALSVLTFYCARSLNAVDNFYEAALLYDTLDNPDIIDTDRLFVWDGAPAHWSEKGELVQSIFLKDLLQNPTTEGLNELKRRCHLYNPYALCSTLGSLLVNRGAYERHLRTTNLMKIPKSQLPAWSAAYTTEIKVNFDRYKGASICRGMNDHIETSQILTAAQNLCVGEWCKAAFLNDEKRMEIITDQYFKVQYSYGCKRARFPPQLMNFIENYDQQIILYEEGIPINHKKYDEMDRMLSFILSQMEKTLIFCEYAAKKGKSDIVLKVLPDIHLEGVLDNIFRMHKAFKKFCKTAPSSTDLSLKATFSEKYAHFFKKAEFLCERHLELTAEALKLRNEKLEADDYKFLLQSSLAAAQTVTTHDLKIDYCEQSLSRYATFLTLFEKKERDAWEKAASFLSGQQKYLPYQK